MHRRQLRYTANSHAGCGWIGDPRLDTVTDTYVDLKSESAGGQWTRTQNLRIRASLTDGSRCHICVSPEAEI